MTGRVTQRGALLLASLAVLGSRSNAGDSSAFAAAGRTFRFVEVPIVVYQRTKSHAPFYAVYVRLNRRPPNLPNNSILAGAGLGGAGLNGFPDPPVAGETKGWGFTRVDAARNCYAHFITETYSSRLARPHPRMGILLRVFIRGEAAPLTARVALEKARTTTFSEGYPRRQGCLRHVRR